MESLCSEQLRRFGVPKLDGLLAPPSEKNTQQKQHQFKGIPVTPRVTHTHTRARVGIGWGLESAALANTIKHIEQH